MVMIIRYSHFVHKIPDNRNISDSHRIIPELCSFRGIISLTQLITSFVISVGVNYRAPFYTVQISPINGQNAWKHRIYFLVEFTLTIVA